MGPEGGLRFDVGVIFVIEEDLEEEAEYAGSMSTLSSTADQARLQVITTQEREYAGSYQTISHCTKHGDTITYSLPI